MKLSCSHSLCYIIFIMFRRINSQRMNHNAYHMLEEEEEQVEEEVEQSWPVVLVAGPRFARNRQTPSVKAIPVGAPEMVLLVASAERYEEQLVAVHISVAVSADVLSVGEYYLHGSMAASTEVEE